MQADFRGDEAAYARKFANGNVTAARTRSCLAETWMWTLRFTYLLKEHLQDFVNIFIYRLIFIEVLMNDCEPLLSTGCRQNTLGLPIVEE
jgi:hypothetical protein